MERACFADTHAAELSRLQDVLREENSALRDEISRQAGIFDSTTNHLMTETSRVRDAAKSETEWLTQELAHSRDLVDQRRPDRSDADEQSAGLRAQVESAALHLGQWQKARDWLKAAQIVAREQSGGGWGVAGAFRCGGMTA